MKRFILFDLEEWAKSDRRKPLIIKGARQVGKTWVVNEFGKRSFKNFVSLDFEKIPGLNKIFEKDSEPVRIIAELELFCGQPIKAGETLLFFDEVQACPKAIMALRYFYENMPNLHVVCAGSLLEFSLQTISVPVGRVQFMFMGPMSFAEYLAAIGREDLALEILQPPHEMPDSVHTLLCDELKRYFFVGGMPEAVKEYCKTKSIRDSFAVQAEICESYRLDFAKYSPHVDKRCLDLVLGAAMQNIGTQLKYTHLCTDFSIPTVKKAFDLLCCARVLYKIPSASLAGLPLSANASSKIFKAIAVDSGIMRYMSRLPEDVEYSKELLAVFHGAMAEQFVGQEMLLSQFQDLYYWNRETNGSNAEIDFIAVFSGKIYPIEVKAGSSGRLRSLHLALKTYPHCEEGMVFSARNYSKLPEERLSFIPLYFAFSATGGIGHLQ